MYVDDIRGGECSPGGEGRGLVKKINKPNRMAWGKDERKGR